MAALTKEEIFAAADAIAREGRQPRVADVHKALGRGSYTTITDAMRDWREVNKPAASTAPESAPEAISGRLTALGDELWALARQTAQAELQKEREAL
ncbi:DNA-binding protein, partial [Paenibacillus sp. HN-1]